MRSIVCDVTHVCDPEHICDAKRNCDTDHACHAEPVEAWGAPVAVLKALRQAQGDRGT